MFSAPCMQRDKRTLCLCMAQKGWDREIRKELLGPALPPLCAVLRCMRWQFGAGCSAGLYWGLQGGCHSCPSPVIIWEGTCPCMGGDIPLLGSDKSPLPPGPSPGCRAVPRSAWKTGFLLSAGAERGGWPCSRFWRFSRGWAVIL